MSGQAFFSKIMNDLHTCSLFKERWNWFRTNKYEELKAYVTSWSEIIGPVLADDHAVWGNRGSAGNAETDLKRVLDWLDARSVYFDSYVSDF